MLNKNKSYREKIRQYRLEASQQELQELKSPRRRRFTYVIQLADSKGLTTLRRIRQSFSMESFKKAMSSTTDIDFSKMRKKRSKPKSARASPTTNQAPAPVEKKSATQAAKQPYIPTGHAILYWAVLNGVTIQIPEQPASSPVLPPPRLTKTKSKRRLTQIPALSPPATKKKTTKRRTLSLSTKNLGNEILKLSNRSTEKYKSFMSDRRERRQSQSARGFRSPTSPKSPKSPVSPRRSPRSPRSPTSPPLSPKPLRKDTQAEHKLCRKHYFTRQVPFLFFFWQT